ncbi:MULTISPECIES: A/G-specific adenine glycosylase [unclassified Arcicella]|uniref:A/G-specific adenine glycosylase n=1 Tax=unclassified Arcicella TaxID=2644986 RepID=UPI0028667D4F|nr:MULTISPECIES: A/G-specific adenine glycosylase [unclassified Arcicella]MDR6563932.1 A/G-specific adenine glycosylase [Arcicella sp. BE51]MDR6813685.1 A/G-specific adenine glycosylase [Arcicella sp. BE140]MDR6824934.1 A/G-specific adenine glycosylase [Arcicella sp. BE139]
MKNDFFSKKITNWYLQHKRDLPWRNTQNPYYIWLSEIILQQTRVAQGMPYYYKFVNAFPTIQDLANAEENEVLRLWQGLGYYSRARNLHKTAKMVVEDYNGIFPKKYSELLKLKGIGTYTAAAIASFSSGEKVAVLDGNVYRVLARVFGETTDISGKDAKKVFTQLAESVLPDDNSAMHNQAIMEFGALQCTPALPNCMFCPLSMECIAYATGRVGVLPVKSKKIKVKERFFNYFIIEQNGNFAMRKRKGRDVWEGMYDFYLKECEENIQDLLYLANEDVFLTDLMKKSLIKRESITYTHILTHQRIQTKFWHLEVQENFLVDLPQELEWYSLNEVDDLPKSTLVNNYLKEFVF